MRKLTIVVAIVMCAFPRAIHGQQSGTAGAPRDVAATLYAEDVMIPMRDGVKVAIDIYRPTRNGAVVEEKLPILMQRTPYSKNGAGLVAQAKYFASQGYVVVLADTRGNYKSEGEFSKYYDFD